MRWMSGFSVTSDARVKLSGAKKSTDLNPESIWWRRVESSSTSSSAKIIATGPLARAVPGEARNSVRVGAVMGCSVLLLVAESVKRAGIASAPCSDVITRLEPSGGGPAHGGCEKALYQDLWLSDERL